MDLSVLGIIPAKRNQFIKKGILNVEDLVNFFPKKYYDFREPKIIKDLIVDEFESIIGKIIEIKKYPKMLKLVVEDEKGWKLDIVFFQSGYLEKFLKINHTYIFCGKVSIPYYRKQMTNPIFSENINKYKKIIPVYSKIQGMSDEYLSDKIQKAINSVSKNEYLDIDTLNHFKLIKEYESKRILHEPKNFDELKKAQDRLIFDELFKFSLITEYEYNKKDKSCKYIIDKTNMIDDFIKTLPFKLTEGEDSQMSTIKSIIDLMKSGVKTTSLIQGDVGCGKTIVALILMLAVVNSGYQAVLMAPTTVLAKQHFDDISKQLKFLGINCAFLGGKLKAKEKREQLENIKTGKANIIIGTHSVISRNVEFKNLALTIVDEEHRFGVSQRRLLQEKSENIHNITMSATPIPRSLAMAIYGDFVNVYTIKTMPKGRKPIITTIESESEKAYDFMSKEIKKGRQCYVVCPLIEESESEKMINIQSTQEELKKIEEYFKDNKEIRICQVNGKMKQEEINVILEDFVNHKYDIIISTTIIEVGVNVPNASVILIKNAERFGLATLHQLRGRVGRGKNQSYCILQTNKEFVERLKVMTETTDGFKIAESDLELRGMGDFIGTKQTGDNKAVMLMLAEPQKYQEIKKYTCEIVKDSKKLGKYQEIIDNYISLIEQDIE